MSQQKGAMKRSLKLVRKYQPPTWRIEMCNRNAARSRYRVELGRIRELHSQHDPASGSGAGAEHHHRQEAAETPHPGLGAAKQPTAALVR